MKKRANEINAFYGAKTEAQKAAERAAAASKASLVRWDGRGKSTVIRISREVAARLNAEIQPQEARRPFVDEAVRHALDKRAKAKCNIA